MHQQSILEEINNKNTNNIFDVVIDIYKNYRNNLNNRKPLSPQEFIKTHYCDKKLFIDQPQEDIFKIFFDLCSVEIFLNSLLQQHKESEKDDKNGNEIINDDLEVVYIYFILFYVTPEKKDAFFECTKKYLNGHSTNIQENVLKLLTRNDMFDIITQKFRQLQKDDLNLKAIINDEKQEYVLQEIKERIPMINDILQAISNKMGDNDNNDLKLYTENKEKKDMVDEIKLEEKKLIVEEDEEEKFLSVLQSPVVYNVLSSIHDDLRKKNVSSAFFRIAKTDDGNGNPNTNKSNIKRVHSNITVSSSTSSSSNYNNLKKTLSNTSHQQSQRSSNGNIQVKQNLTQILREGAQIRKKNEKAKKILDDLCVGAFDPFKINALLDDVRQQQTEEELQEIEKKHLMGKISLEEAKIAKLEQLKMNRERVLELKRQKLQFDIKLSEFRKLELKRIQELGERCRESWEIARQAQSSLLNKKREIVRSLREQSNRYADLIRTRKRKELEQKIALIRQIRELEQVKLKNLKSSQSESHLLSSTSSNISIPYRMSVNELHESLIKLKKEIENDLQIRRNRIREEKLRQQKMITETKSQIERYKGVKETSIAATVAINQSKPSKKNGPLLKITPDILELQQTLKMRQQEVKHIQKKIINKN